MGRLNVYVPDALLEKLRHAQEHTDINLSKLMQDALRDVLEPGRGYVRLRRLSSRRKSASRGYRGLRPTPTV